MSRESFQPDREHARHDETHLYLHADNRFRSSRLKPLLQGNSTIHGYLLLMYFSRRMCGTGRPWAFKASKHTSTMFGLPQR